MAIRGLWWGWQSGLLLLLLLGGGGVSGDPTPPVASPAQQQTGLRRLALLQNACPGRPAGWRGIPVKACTKSEKNLHAPRKCVTLFYESSFLPLPHLSEKVACPEPGWAGRPYFGACNMRSGQAGVGSLKPTPGRRGIPAGPCMKSEKKPCAGKKSCQKIRVLLACNCIIRPL